VDDLEGDAPDNPRLFSDSDQNGWIGIGRQILLYCTTEAHKVQSSVAIASEMEAVHQDRSSPDVTVSFPPTGGCLK
jgi:hypothetical protein